MKITIARPSDRDLKLVVGTLIERVTANDVPFSFTSTDISLDVEWERFLSLMWSTYALLSRGAGGACISKPLRVVLADYGAYTNVSYDGRARGIRYTSLSRII